ncbi:ctenidin-3-like [Scylla paramamosain]|uniref:ctenidin-3-like n=1 Tax=Scylla paramamosain TaxID=85552 RepID=UPI003082E435
MNSLVAILGLALLVASCSAGGLRGGHFIGGFDSHEVIGGGGFVSGGYGGGGFHRGGGGGFHRGGGGGFHRGGGYGGASIVPAIGGLVHSSIHSGGYGSFGGHSIEHDISFGGHHGGYRRPSYGRPSYRRW